MEPMENKLSIAKHDELPEWQLKKHVALIHASGALTKVEKMLVNILLYNAYDELLTKRVHTIPSRYLFDLLGWRGSNNLAGIKKSLKLLGSRVVEFNVLEDGEEDWSFDHFISHARIKGGTCYYKYNEEMAELLYEPEVYAIIRASLEYSLSGTYSMNLYENCVRFKNTKHKTTGWWDLERFRLLMGAQIPSYEDFKYLKRDVIIKPMGDINKNTDIFLTVEYKKEGRKVVAVRFLIDSKDVPSKLFNDDDLDEHSEIINGETYKRLLSAGLGKKLALMYVLNDEKRAKAILNSTDEDVKSGKIKKPSGYIKKVYESDSLIIDPLEIEKQKEVEKSAATAQANAKKQEEAEKNAEINRWIVVTLTQFDALSESQKNELRKGHSDSLPEGITKRNFDQKGERSPMHRYKFCQFVEQKYTNRQ